ncbi:hypothetical protein OHB01_29545 [Microbispora hainanensis]|uniref:Uncharacterized protein n=1 Tax=Microbispora hainanensis TaxID=568844 RepID=A0ABZ1SV35_9ACTN|nr:hypothetical protein [Microbispora hainanensis]
MTRGRAARRVVPRALVWACLRTALYPGDSAWAGATAALHGTPGPTGRAESQ